MTDIKRKKRPTGHKKNKIENKYIVLAVVLGILIIFGGVQALELSKLKTKLNSDINTLSVSSGGQQKIGSSGSGSPSLKKNLQNLPSMVGGC